MQYSIETKIKYYKNYIAFISCKKKYIHLRMVKVRFVNNMNFVSRATGMLLFIVPLFKLIFQAIMFFFFEEATFNTIGIYHHL